MKKRTKYYTTDVEVEVEVELNQFDNDEIIDELSHRNLNKQEKESVANVIGAKFDSKLPLMVDQMKYELFMENINNFTLEQFESYIKLINTK